MFWNIFGHLVVLRCYQVLGALDKTQTMTNFLDSFFGLFRGRIRIRSTLVYQENSGHRISLKWSLFSLPISNSLVRALLEKSPPAKFFCFIHFNSAQRHKNLSSHFQPIHSLFVSSLTTDVTWYLRRLFMEMRKKVYINLHKWFRGHREKSHWTWSQKSFF